MKTKYILALFLVSLPVVTIGSLFKIQHWEGAGLLLTFGMLTQAFAWILVFWKALTHPMLREFMNK